MSLLAQAKSWLPGSRSTERKVVVSWDGERAVHMDQEGGRETVLSTDTGRPSLLDKRLRGAKVVALLAPKVSKWQMTPLPEDEMAARREEEIYWSIFSGREASGFPIETTISKYTAAPGVAGEFPAIGRAVQEEALASLERAAKASGWRIEGALHFIDALAAGCQSLAPSSGGRAAWLVAGKADSTMVVADGGSPAFCHRFKWGDGAASADTENTFNEIEELINLLTRRVSADTPLEGLTVFCPEANAMFWRGFAKGFYGFKISIKTLLMEAEAIPGAVAAEGADVLRGNRHHLDFWQFRPADVDRLVKMMAFGAVAAVLAVSLPYGYAKYEGKKLADLKIEAKEAAEAAKSMPDPALAIAKIREEALALEARVSAANAKRASAEAQARAVPKGSTEAATTLSTIGGFSAEGAGLDGVSARWEDEGLPALSATGTANGRDAAVAAALSLTRLGFGRWGASDAGWTGKKWTFRLDPPEKAPAMAGQAGGQPGSKGGLPPPTQPGADKWGPAGKVGLTLSSGSSTQKKQ